MKKLKTLCIIVLICVVVTTLFLNVSQIQNKIYMYFYPKKYTEYVYKYSEKYGVDPLFVFAIIKTESNFNQNVVSNSGAIGLMQIMESTAEEMAEDEGIKYEKGATLYNPENNIQLGICYYSKLIEIYNGDKGLALAAYNAGMGNVQNWIDDKVIQDDGSDIENIPFNETNNYVRKTLKNYEIYKKLYEQ